MDEYKIMMIPSALAIPVYVAPEEVAIGRTIFHNFLHEEFLQDEEVQQDAEDILLEDEEVNQDNQDGFVDANFAYAHNEIFRMNSSSRYGYSDPQGRDRRIGARLREIANQFARSPQRQLVQHQADAVNLNEINLQNFWTILEEVFLHGIDANNVIALFFFCADVLKRCVKAKLKELGINLFKWSLQYIAEKVVGWIHQHGGWERVANMVTSHKYFKVAAVAILCAAFGYLWIKD